MSKPEDSVYWVVADVSKLPVTSEVCKKEERIKTMKELFKDCYLSGETEGRYENGGTFEDWWESNKGLLSVDKQKKTKHGITKRKDK